MTQEEITNIIQNLNEEELEFALQNAKQQVEVINESLKTTESRTTLLIAFLVAAIAFCIPAVVSCENPTYFRFFCGLVIISYIIEVLIIVHCYFLQNIDSHILDPLNTLQNFHEYKEEYNTYKKTKTLFYIKQTELQTILIDSISPLEELRNKRVEIFNCCLLSTFWFPILFGAIAVTFLLKAFNTDNRCAFFDWWIWLFGV